MLLVMDTAGVFDIQESGQTLWSITSDRIENFLPGLSNEVFKPQQAATMSPEGIQAPEAADSIPSDEKRTAATDSAEQSGKDDVQCYSCVVEVSEPVSEEAVVTEEPPTTNVSLRSTSPLMMESCHFGRSSGGAHPSVILHSPLPSVVSIPPVQLHHHPAVGAATVPLLLSTPTSPHTAINQTVN